MTEQVFPGNKYETRKIKIDYSKLGDKFSLAGNTCHNCKRSLTAQESHSCKNSEKINLRKKTCNKTFCYNCLSNIFPSFLQNISQPDWKCPCCMDQCSCSSCKKIKSKHQKILNQSNILINQSSNKLGLGSNTMMSNGSSESPYDSSKNNYSNENMPNKIVFKDCGNNFDLASFLPKVLGKFNKEKYIPVPRQKIDTIPETLLLSYKRARDEYLEAYSSYMKNHHLDNNI